MALALIRLVYSWKESINTRLKPRGITERRRASPGQGRGPVAPEYGRVRRGQAGRSSVARPSRGPIGGPSSGVVRTSSSGATATTGSTTSDGTGSSSGGSSNRTGRDSSSQSSRDKLHADENKLRAKREQLTEGEKELAPRRGFGTLGSDVMVKTNSFEVKERGTGKIDIYQYQVLFDWGKEEVSK